MRRRKVEKKERNRSSSSKSKYTSNCWWGTRAMNTLAPGITQEAGGLAAGTSKACSNRRSKQDECSGDPKPPARARRERRGNEKGPLYDGCE